MPFQRLAKFLSPNAVVVRRLLPTVRKEVLKIGLLGVLSAVAGSAGLLLLLPLLGALGQPDAIFSVGPLKLQLQGGAPGVLLLGVVILVSTSLYLRYQIEAVAVSLMKSATSEAAVTALLVLPQIEGVSIKSAVRAIMGRIALSCGMVMRQFATCSAELIQLLAYLLVLLALSPLLTLGFLVPLTLVLVLYSRSIERIMQNAMARTPALARLQRLELDQLAHRIAASGIKEHELRDELAGLHRQGAQGHMLTSRLGLRQEIQQGPMTIELLLPLILLPLSVITLTVDGWERHIGHAIVYLLLLRSVIAQAQNVAAQCLALGRFYPDICCYVELQTGKASTCCGFGTDGDRKTDEPDNC